MSPTAPILLVFVDGLGLGTDDPDINPIRRGACPHLDKLLSHFADPVDACLGVPGLPQSATGQTALFTGVNAASFMGRHVEGFPDARLRRIIEERNVFAQLRRSDRKSTFANAYDVVDAAEVRYRRLQSVTTVAALSAFGQVRNREAMESNQAVYQDLTREGLRARGYTGPAVTPEEAAGHLIAIARQYDLTLFEYFQSDRAGHGCDMQRAVAVLAALDAFLGVLMAQADEQGYLLMLASDHGNIEDMRGSAHTDNPVPLVLFGKNARELRGRVRSLTDITPLLVEKLGAGLPP